MTVYQITKPLIENHDAILEVYPALSCWTVEGSADPELVGGVDFYPGALRYYQEAGLIGGGEAAAPRRRGWGFSFIWLRWAAASPRSPAP